MRRAGMVAIVAAMLTAAVACSPGLGPREPGERRPLGTGNGYLDGDEWRRRQDGYLHFATQSLDQGSIANVVAHLARDERERDFRFDASVVGADDFAAVFAKIDAYQDTSDFDMMRLMALWYGYGRRLQPDLRDAIEARFTGFRYWYTDPLPAGLEAIDPLATEPSALDAATATTAKETTAPKGLKTKAPKVKGQSQWDTPLMLLDEPTAFLDLVNRVQLMRLLKEIVHSLRKTVLLSTHDLQTGDLAGARAAAEIALSPPRKRRSPRSTWPRSSP